MSVKNKQPRYATGGNDGVEKRLEFDLSKKDFSLFVSSTDLLGYSKYYVHVQTVGATGTSGTAAISQGPSKEGGDHTTLGPGVAIVATGFGQQFGDVHASYIGVDLSPLTLGSVGRLIVTIIGKQ